MEKHPESVGIKTTKFITWCVVVASIVCVIHSFRTMDLNTFVTDQFSFGVMLFYTFISCISLSYFLLQGILAYRYKPAKPLNDEKLPRCTVIVPAFNEGQYVATTLESVLASDYPPEKLEVIAVNDGSKDDTWEWIQKAAKDANGRIQTMNLIRNGGKRRALYEAIRIASGEVVVTIDSDSAIAHDALRRLVSPFADPAVGAVAGNIRVTNREAGLIPRMLDVAFAFGFEFIRCAQSLIGAVFCTPGALSAYRLSAIRPLMEEWVGQPFMGRPSGIGEDRAITSMLIRKKWRVLFQSDAFAFTKMPVSYPALFKMLTRWCRSDARENLIMLHYISLRHEPFNPEYLGLQLNLVIQSLAMLLPFLFIPMGIYTLVAYPQAFIYYTVIGCVIWSVIPGTIYAVRYGWRESVWAYVYGIYSLPCISWICAYSILTIRNSEWLTRPTASVSHSRRKRLRRIRLRHSNAPVKIETLIP